MGADETPDGAGTSSLGDFNQLCRLGEGAFSVVYKVLRLADHTVYALKMVKLPTLKEKEKQNALNEVRLLASVQHENIIAYKEAFFDDRSRCLCIVTEFADGGDLFQQISRCQKERTRFRENEVWRYLTGMLHGLKALHDMKILHRDLKCANVFLSTGGRDGCIAKLGDFNVSKVAKRGLCLTQTGTPYYASPEVWRDMPYDAKSDLWSMGCVLYETLALRPPFQAEDMEQLYRKVLKGQYPRIPSQYSSEMGEVVAMLLQVNAKNRPSVDDLLATPVMVRHLYVPQGGGGGYPNQNFLLQTIELPQNVINLQEYLPKPRYDVHPVKDARERADSASTIAQANLGGRRPVGAGQQHAPSLEQRHASVPALPLLQPSAAQLGGAARAGSPEAPPQPEPPRASLDTLDAYLEQQQSRFEQPSPEKVERLDRLPALHANNADANSVAGSRQARDARSQLGGHAPQRSLFARPSPGSVVGSVAGSMAQGQVPATPGPVVRDRRSMADCARMQYQQQPQRQAAPQPISEAPSRVRMRLPRIFG